MVAEAKPLAPTPRNAVSMSLKNSENPPILGLNPILFDISLTSLLIYSPFTATVPPRSNAIPREMDMENPASAGGLPVSLPQLPISGTKTGPEGGSELSSAVDLYSKTVNYCIE